MWSPTLEAGTPKPAAIVRALRRAIENGELLAGTRLPPHRDLAHALGVNLSTVTRAMNDARREGLIAAEVGRGTYVMPTSDAATIFAQTISRKELTDLSSISPPPLGAELIRAAMCEVVADEPDITGYPQMHHLCAGSDAVVDWFRWRGMEVLRDRVALTAGAQAALHAVLSCAMRPGETLLVEEFTFPASNPSQRCWAFGCMESPATTRGCCPTRWSRPSARPRPGPSSRFRTCRTRPDRRCCRPAAS